MASFYYNYQNSFRFPFQIPILFSQWTAKNNSFNQHEETKTRRILVVVVKWRHSENVLFVVFEKFTSAYLSQIAREKSCESLLIIYMKKSTTENQKNPNWSKNQIQSEILAARAFN